MIVSRLPHDNEKALTNILRLGHFFQYEAAQQAAINALEHLPSFGAVVKFAYGLKFGIRHWIVDGFTELVTPRKHRQLTHIEVEQLELMPYHAVVETQARIEAHRRLIAYSVPAISHGQGMCIRA